MSDKKTALEFVKYVLENICEDVGAIEINQSEDELGTLITIKVAENDMGRLIGKSGKTISSLRTLVRVIGGRDNEKVNLKILEDES